MNTAARFSLPLLFPLALAGCMIFCPPPKSVHDDKPKTVVVQTTDESGAVTLNRGDTLRLVLPGNPTTGFTWERASGAGSLLAENGDYVFTPAKKDIAGSPGEFAFTFLASHCGEDTLTMHYLRPFEKNTPPAKTFSLKVTVR